MEQIYKQKYQEYKYGGKAPTAVGVITPIDKLIDILKLYKNKAFIEYEVKNDIIIVSINGNIYLELSYNRGIYKILHYIYSKNDEPDVIQSNNIDTIQITIKNALDWKVKQLLEFKNNTNCIECVISGGSSPPSSPPDGFTTPPTSQYQRVVGADDFINVDGILALLQEPENFPRITFNHVPNTNWRITSTDNNISILYTHQPQVPFVLRIGTTENGYNSIVEVINAIRESLHIEHNPNSCCNIHGGF
jgi:hypothetical protein